MLAGYLAAHRSDLSRSAWFIGGVVLMFVALTSPIDTLGDTYLFSAHMLQHMILILIVPPLLIAGLTQHFARAVTSIAALGALERSLRRPAIAWTLAIATLWLWHLPALFDAAVANEDIHIFEHLCFMLTATIFWWPILSPLESSRMAAMPAILYLFAGMLATSVLGIAITFAPPGLYAAYAHPHDAIGILPLLRNSWGLTPAVDQKLGGLLMWVPGGLAFLAAIMLVMARWYRTPEETGATAFN